MGYYTSYSLEVKTFPARLPAPDIEAVMDALRREVSSANYALDTEGDTREACKWYDHEKELREFSKDYPAHLFVLRGEGESARDLWVKYFVGGKCQAAPARIDFEDFDAEKLQ